MSTDGADIRGPWDLVVVGHGFAGLSAAVAFLEAQDATNARVAVIDRARRDERGGSTRWAPGIFRFPDDRAESATLDWLKSHGVGSRPLVGTAPGSATKWFSLAGGGRGFIERYEERAARLGARFFPETHLVDLHREPQGRVTGVEVRTFDRQSVMDAKAIVLASGGFEGATDELARRIPGGELLEPASTGARLSTGAGIAAAVRIGATRTGRADTAVLLPIDPRSDRIAPIVGTWLWGILVDLEGRRFLDEAETTFALHADPVARAVLARGGLAFAITDASVRAATPMLEAAQRTDQPVITADSIEELADRLGMDSSVLERTVAEYNASTVGTPYDGNRLDGRRTAGIFPEKSNWAHPLTTPPFEALPVGAGVAFTTDGLVVDDTAHVLDDLAQAIPGLYAAGAVTGLPVDLALSEPTSCLRAIAAGRTAGVAAAQESSAITDS
jgi:tricarballylate dehydrogenase